MNGPETRTVLLTISGLSTNSSEVALAAMHSLTSSIFARHAARQAASASRKNSGQSGPVSKDAFHSCHSPFFDSLRRGPIVAVHDLSLLRW